MVYSPVNPWTFPINPNFPFVQPINYITNITQSRNAILTTATPHGYNDGLFVRIVFPYTTSPAFGMVQINEQICEITVIDSTNLALNIDTTGYDAFTLSASKERPQIVPMGVTASSSNNDSTQVNPVNPHRLSDVRIFQPISPQSKGPCTVP